MNNPFLKNVRWQLGYFCGWAAIAWLTTCLSDYWSIASDHIVLRTALQAAYILLVWNPIRYVRNTLSVPLFMLFHVLLLSVVVAIWWGQGLLLVPEILLYIIFVLLYYLLCTTAELKAQQEKIAVEASASKLVPAEKLTRISVKKHRALFFIPVTEIIYIEANGDYVMIYTAKAKYLKDKSMKYWETMLPEDLFVRIHRSFILNVEHIAKVELYEKETYKVLLKNGVGIKASAAGYKLLKQKIL
ncbi:response regulator of the LytR/AlgR family [Candidatus Symbiothrix dinenymphae]|nr:response regulator of the LytR/AlgR family [Candidatus Symbiothrix dinenymphae]